MSVKTYGFFGTLFGMVLAGFWALAYLIASRMVDLHTSAAFTTAYVRLYLVLFALHGLIGCLVGITLKRARDMSIIDCLTPVYNRNFLLVTAEKQMAMAKRQKQPFSLVIVDLDNFKGYNDSKGHLEGDNLLFAVADSLRSHIRQSDTIARFGGDEFVVLLPYTDGDGALQLTKRMQEALSKLHITFSAGISTYPNNADTVKTLLLEADKALYEAKILRNSVMVAKRYEEPGNALAVN